jgi:ubiquinone/menaquinone biosynthesis C-methylase UbiE
MKRVLEPEIMGIEQEAAVYASADFGGVNQKFADRLFEMLPRPRGLLVDLGCGPGDIVIRIARGAGAANLTLIGVDGARAMLRYVEKAVPAEYKAVIVSVQGDAKRTAFKSASCDVIVANSLAHHLADPLPFWKEVQRIGKEGAFVLVRDLARPPSEQQAHRIVERESGGEPQLLKDLFFHSLCASFTVAEITEQVRTAGLTSLSIGMCSDRHWEAAGKIVHR